MNNELYSYFITSIQHLHALYYDKVDQFDQFADDEAEDNGLDSSPEKEIDIPWLHTNYVPFKTQNN